MGKRKHSRMGWEESAEQIVSGVKAAQQDLSENKHTLSSSIQGGFAQLRKLLDDTERQLTNNLQGVIQSREQQLQEWEQNVTSHRESLRAGTREIQQALQSGDMALVSERSKELEVSTNALKEMESAFPSLNTPLGGDLNFAAVEAALGGLAFGANSGGNSAQASSSYVPAAAPAAATPVMNTGSFN